MAVTVPARRATSACVREFIAIVTHPKIYRPPSPLAVALNQVDARLESPTLHLLGESPGYWQRLRVLLVSARITGPLVHDARIAALAIDHGVRELWSADRDLGRFAPLKVRNRLVVA